MLELRALHTHVDGLRPRRLQLRLRLGHVHLRGHAALEPYPRQLQRALERGHAGVQQLPLDVERAQLEVVERQLGLQAQTRGLEIGRARLGAGLARLHAAAYLAPEIRRPRHVDGKLEEVRRAARTAGARAHTGAGGHAGARRRGQRGRRPLA